MTPTTSKENGTMTRFIGKFTIEIDYTETIAGDIKENILEDSPEAIKQVICEYLIKDLAEFFQNVHTINHLVEIVN
jgi:hypothetical protein